MMQDLQVVLGAAAFVAAGAEPIVSNAETRRWKQIVAVGIIGEGARLAHQRIDDVAIVHGMLVATHQARQRVHLLVGVPDLDAVGEQPGLDLRAAQTTVHRIGIALNVHQAARIDTTAHLQTRRQPCVGQIAQGAQLLGEAIVAAGVPRRRDLLQEIPILFATGEIATAAEQQRLLDSSLEVPVRRLGVAVLVRLSHIDPLAGQAVVRQQVTIARLEFPLCRQVVHRGAQAIAAMPRGHAAEFPQRVLQAVRQGLE